MIEFETRFAHETYEERYWSKIVISIWFNLALNKMIIKEICKDHQNKKRKEPFIKEWNSLSKRHDDWQVCTVKDFACYA